MGFVKAVHKLSDAIDKVMGYVIFAMLLLMVIITGAQIVCRIFFKSLQWSEEDQQVPTASWTEVQRLPN